MAQCRAFPTTAPASIRFWARPLLPVVTARSSGAFSSFAHWSGDETSARRSNASISAPGRARLSLLVFGSACRSLCCCYRNEVHGTVVEASLDSSPLCCCRVPSIQYRSPGSRSVRGDKVRVRVENVDLKRIEQDWTVETRGCSVLFSDLIEEALSIFSGACGRVSGNSQSTSQHTTLAVCERDSILYSTSLPW